MRIAYDHQIFGWQKYGGISRYCYEVARNIASSERDEVFVVAPLHVNSYLHDDPGKIRVRGLQVPQIRRTGRIYRAVNQLLVKPWMHRIRPRVIHETYYAMHSVTPRGAAVVVTVHDMIHERFPRSFSAWDTTSREKVAAVLRADHVICVSHNTHRDLLARIDIDPSKTSVIHHGFSLLRSHNLNATDAISSPMPRPFILYVGSRGGYKNFEMLLRAVAASPSLKTEYDIVAFGGGGFSAAELEFARSCGLDNSRLRHQSGGDNVLELLYRRAALFVYPSLYEGFGIPPLEAMSFGCPVVCSNASSLPEVVGDAAELFDPESESDLGQAMERVLSDTQRREELVRLGTQRLSLFSWQRCAEQTRDVYQRFE